MVEMTETSTILNQATAASFVVLDELGRGTSLQDGLALATVATRHLASAIGCRTLFATHFHQLCAAPLPATISAHHVVAPILADGSVTFSHVVQPGQARESHGLAVAGLAGVASPLLQSAAILKADLDRCVVYPHAC